MLDVHEIYESKLADAPACGKKELAAYALRPAPVNTNALVATQIEVLKLFFMIILQT